jgi:hypothetical protein
MRVRGLTNSVPPARITYRKLLIGLLREKHAVEDMNNPVAAQKVGLRDTDVIDQHHPVLSTDRQVSAVEAPDGAQPDGISS